MVTGLVIVDTLKIMGRDFCVIEELGWVLQPPKCFQQWRARNWGGCREVALCSLRPLAKLWDVPARSAAWVWERNTPGLQDMEIKGIMGRVVPRPRTCYREVNMAARWPGILGHPFRSLLVSRTDAQKIITSDSIAKLSARVARRCFQPLCMYLFPGEAIRY